MTFDQIHYFLAIVKFGTYMEAAEELHVSQSSLSKQIQKLERELHVQLFDRNRRKAELTEAGNVFLEDARGVWGQYQEVLEHLRPFQSGEKGVIRLGTLPVLAQYGLIPILRDYGNTYPHIKLVLEEVEDTDLMAGLRDGSYDFVITREILLKDSDTKKLRLAEDELAALIPAEHKLADRPFISIEDLKQEKFLLMHKHISIHQLCIDLCHSYGFEPNILRTARVESILSSVAAGEGISLLCRENVRVFQYSDIVVLPLEKPIKTTIALAWNSKRKLSSIEKQFLSFWKQQVPIG